MKTLREILTDKLAKLTHCPCCANAQLGSDFGESRDWRHPDDCAAVSFSCGSEFSIDDQDQIVSRVPCPDPSATAAYNMTEEADDELRELEEADDELLELEEAA
jgi:hypothetical protein